MEIGRAITRQNIDVNLDLFMQAIKDVKAGSPLQLSDTEYQETMQAFQKQMMEKAMVARKAAGDKAKQEGEAFLAENKSKPGVITLPDGLQYQIITVGKGKKPTENDKVQVNYTGTLVNGTEFDSSAKHGGPGYLPRERPHQGLDGSAPDDAGGFQVEAVRSRRSRLWRESALREYPTQFHAHFRDGTAGY